MNKPVKQEVHITLSSIINDLENGVTWLKSQDVGNGSIQEKYDAREVDILAIRQHPKLVGLEPNLKVYFIKDDLNESITSTTSEGSESDKTGSDDLLSGETSNDSVEYAAPGVDSNSGGDVPQTEESTNSPGLSKFLNL